MLKIIIASGVAISALCVAVPADAATLLFQLTGSKDATFQLDSNPTPDSFTSTFIGDQISFNNVAGIFGGTPGVASSISFGTNLINKLDITGTSLGFTQFTGPALFTGPASSPVFAPGTFSLVNFVFGPATLTISQVAVAVPEPSSWAMMLIGFGMLGAAARYRRRKTAISYA